MHRNSQKRIYLPNVAYFITNVTKNRYPYFKEEIFCRLFAENLRICQKLKGFKIYGWFLGYDHCHLLVKPNEQFNISRVMQSLKRNTSHNMNYVLGDIEARIIIRAFNIVKCWKNTAINLFKSILIRTPSLFFAGKNHIMTTSSGMKRIFRLT